MTLSKALCASSAAPAESLVVANETRISLRQVGPCDRAGLAALFARLTPGSRSQRFLSPKRELPRLSARSASVPSEPPTVERPTPA